ncbi:MAG: RNA polymerase sigma factor [Alphaproteobacteria bacterium]|nr:RNA polymerase sigma factor [Alphaproteobacteria bacterium]
MNPRAREAPLQHLDDNQLIREFRRGREQAFEVLVRRHGASIKAYALRMLHNPEQAEEVFEETFLRVATAQGRWEDRGTVRGYLFTIAHRLCIDLLRRRKVARDAVPHLVELQRGRRVQPSPEAAAAMGQRAERLEQAIAQLSEEHRQVLLMRTLHGLSAAETGAALGLSESQIHSQLSYARRRLRSILADMGDALNTSQRRRA